MKQLMLILEESQASAEAKKKGLEYLGFGRYGKNKKMTHKVVNGKLTPVGGGKEPVKPTKQPTEQPTQGDEYSFKSQTPGSKFSAESDVWFDDVSEWSIDPMKRGTEHEASKILNKLSTSAPTPKTIKRIYDVASKINRPPLKRIASQAAKILKNAYSKEFKRQFGKSSQAAEFLDILRQAMNYNQD